MNWDNPKTPKEATAIIDEAEIIFLSINKNDMPEDHDNDFLKCIAKDLAIFGACFNHNFTRTHRDRIMNILVANAEIALEPVLEALADNGRTEQIDFTWLFINKAYTIKGDIQ